MDGGAAALFHVRGGISFKEKVAIGGFYNIAMNQINPDGLAGSALITPQDKENVYMDYWSVGGFIEVTAWSKKLVHLSFPLYVGFGEVQMDNEAGAAGYGEQNFFQIEPSALLELNLHKNVRFNVGAGYRIVGEMDYLDFIDQSNVSGITGYAGLKFGLFD